MWRERGGGDAHGAGGAEEQQSLRWRSQPGDDVPVPARSTGAGGDNGIAQMRNRRGIPVSSY
eukprot:COSAG01_NODE_11500_length_1920_cov_5.016474_4_plen_61_part_01